MPTNRIPGDKRGTRAWRHLVKRVVAEEPWCWLNYPGICTTRSQTADHIHPVKTHPALCLARANVHGACHRCNNRRKAAPPPPWARVAAARYPREPEPPADAVSFFDV